MCYERKLKMKRIDAKNYYEELKFFLKNYYVPLMGFPSDTEVYNDNVSNEPGILIKGNKIFFTPLAHVFKSSVVVEIKHGVNILPNSEEEKLTSVIFQSFDNFSRFSSGKGVGTIPLRRYETDSVWLKNLEHAIQYSICQWICGFHKVSYVKIESLLDILEDWAKKTYEGKKISFSIIVDPTLNPVDDNDTFLNFLDDEYSAMLTDCITSSFLIDTSGSLRDYLSTIEISKRNVPFVEKYQLINNLPIRFASLMQKHVTGERVGVFLLSNGDIVLAKKQRIRFIKRNNHWLNFSYDAFKNSLSSFKIKDKLISEIFSTAIDVSLAHSGGIIAYQKNDKFYAGEKTIIHEFDVIYREMTEQELVQSLLDENSDMSRDQAESEAKKRLIKKSIIRKMIDYSDDYKHIPFIKIERKLRSDLAALDGAFVIDSKGSVVSIGTIIESEKGSSGGGRSAAAKRLSDNGFAIKISTDGYIEVFVIKKKVYAIK